MKVWSVEVALIEDLMRLYEANSFDYLEIYVIPDKVEDTAGHWHGSGMPVLLHAPHWAHGVNLARSDLRKSNLKIMNSVRRFADDVSASNIIVHPGNNGSLDEFVQCLKILGDSRILVENKPRIGINGELCVGCYPEEFECLRRSEVLNGVVLDFGHAVNAANSAGMAPMRLIRDFMGFRPACFHLSDGKWSSKRDEHLGLGLGDYCLPDLLALVPQGARVTLEVARTSEAPLDSFLKSVEYLEALQEGE